MKFDHSDFESGLWADLGSCIEPTGQAQNPFDSEEPNGLTLPSAKKKIRSKLLQNSPQGGLNFRKKSPQSAKGLECPFRA
jgi:hypothetical protein